MRAAAGHESSQRVVGHIVRHDDQIAGWGFYNRPPAWHQPAL